MASQPSPVRIGVIGLGQWGPNHVRSFGRMEGCEIVRICDRSQEYLGSSDSVITRYRRMLIEQIRSYADGRLPPSLAGDLPYESRRAHAVIHPESVDWRDAIALQTAQG